MNIQPCSVTCIKMLCRLSFFHPAKKIRSKTVWKRVHCWEINHCLQVETEVQTCCLSSLFTKMIGFKSINSCKSYAVVLMVTRSQPVWTRPVDFGPMCQTALCLTKTPNLGISVGRMVFHSSIRVSETFQKPKSAEVYKVTFDRPPHCQHLFYPSICHQSSAELQNTDFLANPDAIHKLWMFAEYLTLISRAVKQIYTILQTAVAPTLPLHAHTGAGAPCGSVQTMFEWHVPDSPDILFKILFWLFGNKICGFKSWQICVICAHNFQILFYPSIQYNSHGPSLPVGSIECLVWGVYLLLRWTAVEVLLQLQLLARWWQKERWEAAMVLSWRNYILLLLTTLRWCHFRTVVLKVLEHWYYS